jgi:hypothetical protein
LACNAQAFRTWPVWSGILPLLQPCVLLAFPLSTPMFVK